MAKRGAGNATMDQAAGKIGSLLGKVAARVDSMKRQRAEIAAELDHVISVAQQMKVDLGFAMADARRAAGKARRQMSPEARERIAAAARKRWIAYRKEKAKAAGK